MARPMSRAEWRRKKRRKAIIIRTVVFVILLTIVTLAVIGAVKLFRNLFMHEKLGTFSSVGDVRIQAELLTVNDYSRPGIRMNKSDVKGIVIHFSGLSGTTAIARRNYFEQLASTRQNSLGSHFVVGTGGEIIQCIPVTEECCDNGKHNCDMISIEYCHTDEDGMPSKEAYASLLKLTAGLLRKFNLDSSNVYLHSEVTDLDIVCPKYYVENPDKWASFKSEVANYILTYGKQMNLK